MLRIHVYGPLAVELPDAVLTEGDFPGRQGRLAFAFLALNRDRHVTRHELSEAIWDASPPRSWENAVSALASKIRRLVDADPWSDVLALDGGPAGYRLRFAGEHWVDADAVRGALDHAAGALRRDDLAASWASANVAVSIASRPFFPDETLPWVTIEQERQRRLLVRGLEILGESYLANHEPEIAAELATRSRTIEPFRESAHRLLMRAHHAAGNRAEALRVFEACRALLIEELGVDPSPESEQVYLEILGAPPAASAAGGSTNQRD